MKNHRRHHLPEAHPAGPHGRHLVVGAHPPKNQDRCRQHRHRQGETQDVRRHQQHEVADHFQADLLVHQHVAELLEDAGQQQHEGAHRDGQKQRDDRLPCDILGEDFHSL